MNVIHIEQNLRAFGAITKPLGSLVATTQSSSVQFSSMQFKLGGYYNWKRPPPPPSTPSMYDYI